MTAGAAEDASPWAMVEILRRAHPFTQQELAARAGIARWSISTGETATGRMGRDTAEKLAPVLEVDPAQLLSGRWPDPRLNPQVHAVLRAALMAVVDPPCGVVVDRAAVAEMSQQVLLCWQQYILGENMGVLRLLPAVLSWVRASARGPVSDGAVRAELHHVLSRAYNIGSGLAGRFGLHDLAFCALDRSRAAAELSPDPDLAVAVAERYVSWTLIRQGRLEEAAALAVRRAQSLEPVVSRLAAVEMSVWGNLAFNAAQAYARLGKTDRALELIAATRRVTRGLEHEKVSEAGIFGPRAVVCQSVEIHRLCGDPGEALRQGSQVATGARGVPAFFEAGHRLHLAAAALDVNNKPAACEHLHLAHAAAPEWVRGQPLGPALVRRVLLLRRGRSRNATELTALARGYGLIGSAEQPAP